jgi:uncharacterized membrane protein
MSAESSLIAAGALSWLFTLGTQLAFLVAIATLVRRHRPDASPVLLGAVIFELLVTGCSYVAELILPALTARSTGIPGYMTARAISNVVFAGGHSAAQLLLLWGIIRLARPSEPEAARRS